MGVGVFEPGAFSLRSMLVIEIAAVHFADFAITTRLADTLATFFDLESRHQV